MAKLVGLGAVKKVPAPTVVQAPEPTVMPVVDQTLINQNKKKAVIAASNRSGRASTIMSDTTTLGGNSWIAVPRN